MNADDDLPPLSGNVRSLVEEPDAWRRYGDTYGVERGALAVISGAVAASWTDGQIESLLLDRGTEVGRRTLAHFGPTTARFWVGGEIEQVRDKHEQHASDCTELAALVYSHWPDSRKRRALRVALAMVSLAEQAGRFSFTASQRQITCVAGVGGISNASYDVDRGVVAEAIEYLRQIGFVTHVGRPDRTTLDEVHKANSYRLATAHQFWWKVAPSDPATNGREASASLQEPFGSPVVAYGDSSRPAGSLKSSGVERYHDLLHVVWEEAALGMTACRVWHLLRTAPFSVTEIAERAKIARKTALGTLRKLHAHGLCDDTPAGWVVIEGSLDQLAAERGWNERPQLRVAVCERAQEWRTWAMRQRYDGWKADGVAPRISPRTGLVTYETVPERVARGVGLAAAAMLGWAPLPLAA